MKRRAVSLFLAAAVCTTAMPATTVEAKKAPENTRLITETYFYDLPEEEVPEEAEEEVEAVIEEETLDTEAEEIEEVTEDAETEPEEIQEDADAPAEEEIQDAEADAPVVDGEEVAAEPEALADAEELDLAATAEETEAIAEEAATEEAPVVSKKEAQAAAKAEKEAKKAADKAEKEQAKAEKEAQKAAEKAEKEQAKADKKAQKEEDKANKKDPNRDPVLGENEALYRIYLPENYDENRAYPTVYVMPYDGYKAAEYLNSGILSTVDGSSAGDDSLQMIFVFPEFTEENDYGTMLDDLVADVEEKYSVIEDAAYRGIFGASVGGYMAMETAVIEASDLFYAVSSSMGDFTSESNPWIGKGDVNTAINGYDSTGDKGYSTIGKHFYYIDAPNGSARSTQAGGTSTIGANLAKRSNPYYKFGGSYYLYSTPDPKMVEYRILDGGEDAAFYLNSVKETMNRFSARFTENLYSAAVAANPQAVTSGNAAVNVTVNYTLSSGIAVYNAAVPAVTFTLKLTDPATGAEIYRDQATVDGLTTDAPTAYTFTVPRECLAEGKNTDVAVEASILGFGAEVGTVPIVRVEDAIVDGNNQSIDLMGDWYFKAYKSYKKNDTTVIDLDRVENIVPETYQSWGVVQPALAWWTADFDASLGGSSSYGGYAWYVRTFEVPEGFAVDQQLTVAVGMFDEANEVYINGTYVGSTGMQYDIAEGIGVYDGSNPWDVNCVYQMDPNVLHTGTNTIAVRMCNSSGGGGWYSGPVGIYTEEAYANAAASGSRLTVESYESASTGNTESFRLYLPKDYYEEGNTKSYPTMVLLHGINSQSSAYEIDRVDKVLDDAIEAGIIEPMIVVIPDDPTKSSFWKGKYADMVTQDLIPYVDANYRTIQDPGYRFTAGCSMGGGGAYSLAINNPDLFSGLISFYGALNYVGAEDLTNSLSTEYLSSYSIWMASGNQDMYNFYDVQEKVSNILTSKGVSHYHLVDNGTHTTSFYLPLFIQAIQYTQQNMFR
ncbi:MAG: alpha/beta hydrolase-fold protein [Lachnospiraceae bacterium]|nr:alpha/beta hydrolase-fold protein [Lachnospiraceae bacterium]